MMNDKRGDPDDPRKDFQHGNDDRRNKTDFGAPDDSHRRVPIADRQEQRHRRGDDRQVKKENNDDRIDHQAKGDAVEKDPLMVEGLDFAFGAAGIQAGGTKMLSVERAITERAKKAAATVARQHRFFLRMIKTA